MGNSNSSSNAQDTKSAAPIVTQKDRDAEYAKFLDTCIINGPSWEGFVENLRKHIEDDNGKRLNDEWQTLVERDQYTSQNDDLFTAGREPCNLAKNRYSNILPLDTTRVKLKEIEGVPCSDYINANFVMCGDRKYICAQAPLESTFADFYRMIWEQNVSVVVMLTKIVEGGKLKAHSYWPVEKGSSEPYGDIVITTLTEDPDPSKEVAYVQRKFQLTRGEETRPLTQFHFIAWPDFGTPEDAQPLLDMMDEVNRLVDVSKENIVVHCSAGIGRTGSYIMIDYFRNGLARTVERQKSDPSQQSYEPPTINIVKTTHHLRESRSGMVNSQEQFVFCYRVVEKFTRDLVLAKGGLLDYLKLPEHQRQKLARKKVREERRRRDALLFADGAETKSRHSHKHHSGHRSKKHRDSERSSGAADSKSRHHRSHRSKSDGSEKPRKHRHRKDSSEPDREQHQSRRLDRDGSSSRRLRAQRSDASSSTADAQQQPQHGVQQPASAVSAPSAASAASMSSSPSDRAMSTRPVAVGNDLPESTVPAARSPGSASASLPSSLPPSSSHTPSSSPSSSLSSSSSSSDAMDP